MSSSSVSGAGARAWWVAGLLLLAFAVRFAPALVPHFWWDEIYTIKIIQARAGEILGLTVRDSHPPLYYYWVKCFAALGRRLGGPFVTLAWLRLSSILPGIAACLLGWLAARRWWGPRRALYVLSLFALAPALTYYSVELRNYALMHTLLLGAMIGVLEIADPLGARIRAGIGLTAVWAALVFYTHSLSCLYLGFLALIFMAEIALQSGRRRALLIAGTVAVLPVAIGCAFWIPYMRSQASAMNQSVFATWASWRDLPLTLFWHLPFGYWPGELNPGAWFPWAVALNGAGLFLLLAHAARKEAAQGPDSEKTDRLFLYSGILATLPVLTAILISHFHIAKVSLRYRWNLIAAPFFMLFLAGLIFRVRPRLLRRALLAGLLAACAAFSVIGLRTRLRLCNEITEIARTRDPEALQPGSRFYWASPAVPFWLKRSGSIEIGRFEEAVSNADGNPAGTSCLLLHQLFGSHYPGAGLDTVLLEAMLAKYGATRVDITGYWEWERIWRAAPAVMAEVRGQWPAAQAALKARREGIPDGRVILADTAATTGLGWGPAEYDKKWMPQCWSVGAWQRLDWDGPERPGRYRFELIFYRGNPFPEKEITVKYRLLNQETWSEQRAGMGWVRIAGEVAVRAPREKMKIELVIPTWVPEKCIPGSNDPRALGMIFTALELRPL